MLRNYEVKSAKVGVKKDGDFEYPTTVTTLHTVGYDASVGNYVGRELDVSLGSISFQAKFVRTGVKTMKIEGEQTKVTEVVLEVNRFDERIGHMVGKTASVELL